MIKKGVFMGIGLYLALLLAGAAFNACSKSESKLSSQALLLFFGQHASSNFVTIPEGMAH